MCDGENSSHDFARNQVEQIRARIRAACDRARRDPEKVLLIGASKTVEAEKLDVFWDAGLHHCGENYVQEGIAKIEFLRAKHAAVKWHFIGSLQSNKAREAVKYFDYIQSVDRPSLVAALENAARAENKVQQVLLQVNIGDEETKAGCNVGDAKVLSEKIVQSDYLRLSGLMCLPPYRENPEEMRPYFQALRGLRDEIASAVRGIKYFKDEPLHLSMGMSNDFEVAIEEGATMVRVGTALFGERRNIY